MTTRWRFPRLKNERTVVGSDVLEVDGDGFVVGEVSPATHALLAAARFSGVRYWELVTVSSVTPHEPTPPLPNTPALDAVSRDTLAPTSSTDTEPVPVAAASDTEPATIVPASETKTRKRGKA